jgi:hydrogenase maturation protein HypF
MAGREVVLRRARGSAPLPVQLPATGEPEHPQTVLAVGAHLKNTVALSVGSQVFISQHIGDLETEAAYGAFRRVISDFQALYESSPTIIAADDHPDYLSTRFAREIVSGVRSSELTTVQHHLAHVLSCMAENELQPPVLGVSWDGTGYGLDETVWGGEFFLVTQTSWERVAHLRQFRLSGGDKAVKEPRRVALGLLYEIFGAEVFDMEQLAPVRDFSRNELASLKTMLARGLNSPFTSSAGRLFDAVASLVGIRQQVHFEGQAAMELEFALNGIRTEEAYAFKLADPRPPSIVPAPLGTRPAPLVLDWSPVIQAILADLEQNVSVRQISARFHNALAEAIVLVARSTGQERVALSGGCFQNLYLTERAIQRLQEKGFRPYWHQRVPPNDGGIALGQVAAALRYT